MIYVPDRYHPSGISACTCGYEYGKILYPLIIIRVWIWYFSTLPIPTNAILTLICHVSNDNKRHYLTPNPHNPTKYRYIFMYTNYTL
jgi:hypothetical protein